MFSNRPEEGIPVDSFAYHLSLAIQEMNLKSFRAAEKHLESVGIYDIKEKRISEYCAGMHTPPFEKARKMLDAMDYLLSDEELTAALSNSRRYARERPREYRRENDRELRISLRLKLSRIAPDVRPEQAEEFLSQRIEELCGDRKKFTEYIQALIYKDMTEFILNKSNILSIREETK